LANPSETEEKIVTVLMGRIEKNMKEIRFRGRGGQGVVMGAEMLA
jgi:hypothetical protein